MGPSDTNDCVGEPKNPALLNISNSIENGKETLSKVTFESLFIPTLRKLVDKILS